MSSKPNGRRSWISEDQASALTIGLGYHLALGVLEQIDLVAERSELRAVPQLMHKVSPARNFLTLPVWALTNSSGGRIILLRRIMVGLSHAVSSGLHTPEVAMPMVVRMLKLSTLIPLWTQDRSVVVVT